MPATVSHILSATTPDDPAWEIRPSHWNSNHAFALNATGSEISGAFTNGGGVSFGLSANGALSATVATTYRASNDAVGLNTAQSNVTWTVNSSGISLDARGYAGTATAVTGRASITVNSAGVSFNGTNLAGVGTAITGNASISVNSSGISFNGSNLAGVGTSATNASITLNSNGLAISVAAPGAESNAVHLLGANTAGNTTATGSTIGWSGVNLTLSGTNGSQVVVSGPGTSSLSGTGAVSISANGATVSIGVPNLSIYASSNTTAQSSSSSVALGSLTVRGMGGLSVGMSAGELILSGGAAAGLAAIYDGANSISSGTVRFTNANGVTFTFNGQTLSGSVATTYRASNDAIGLNTAQSNVTWTVNSSGLSLDARNYAGTGTTFNGANISGSITHNSVGVNLSLSVAAPGAAAESNAFNLLGANTAGNTTATGSTIGLSGVNLTLSGTNNSQIVISAPATSSLVGSSGLSFSTNGSTITAYAVARSEWNNFGELLVGGTAQANSLVSIQPFMIEWPLVFSNVAFPLSIGVGTQTNNSSAYVDISASGVIYTRNVSSLSSVASFSASFTQTWSSNATGTVTGGKLITATLGGTTLTPGNYWIALHVSTNNTATGGANTTALANTISMIMGSSIATAGNLIAPWNAQTNASQGLYSGLGMISTGATLASIPFSSITNSGSRAVLAPVAFGLRNATYQ